MNLITGHILIVIAIILYFAVILAVGFSYARRSNSSTDEYFLGGRSVGPWFTALSAEASDMSGWLLMGLPGVAYFTGASDAVWIAIGLGLGTYFNWKLVARRLRLYSSQAGNAITLPEFYSNRFHDKKNLLSTVAALITLIFFCVYVGSTFVTAGKLFSVLFGLDYATMMIIGAVIVFLYTLVGGYLSVVATDSIQATLMFFALAIVLIGSVASIGGVEQTAAALKDFPGFLDSFKLATPVLDEAGQQVTIDGIPQFGKAVDYGLIGIVSSMVWGLGYFGMPHVLVRFMGIRTAGEIKVSRRIAVTWAFISLICAISIGLIGRALIPAAFTSQAAAETIFIVLAQMLLPAFFTGIVVSGILAASMSSASSYLLIAGSSVAENIYRGLFKRDATDKQVLMVARITLFAVLLFGIVIALDENSSIFTIVSYAWAGLGASFGPLTLCALYWKRTTKEGALAGMITGAVTVLVWANLIKPMGGLLGVYELLPAFFLALAAIIVVSLLTPAPGKAVEDEFDAYLISVRTPDATLDAALE